MAPKKLLKAVLHRPTSRIEFDNVKEVTYHSFFVHIVFWEKDGEEKTEIFHHTEVVRIQLVSSDMSSLAAPAIAVFKPKVAN